MTAHLSDSDRQALRLAHDLREELRRALPQVAAAPSVSPFVDPGGRPSVLMRMDAETAQALMAVLAERQAPAAPPQAPEPRRADGTLPPPQAGPVPIDPGPQASPFATAPAGPFGSAAPLLPTAFPGH
ncbi:hypothetical protein [Actinomadura flavalba]|uniref:hypothetical protein n=1 Tax=Actinomadura flavalba TaxID=1120938 RepID=UPI0005242175|nr:hypothetical protein [Actinomadura flavalba]